MSKDTFVKAAAQGGDSSSGGGGGPAGNWTLVDKGTALINGNSTATLYSLLVTPPPNVILVAFVGIDGGASNHFCEGTSAVAPNANTIVWNMVINGTGTDLVVRTGAAVSQCNISWALYEFSAA